MNRNKSKAFTLIEAVLTLAVFGILATVAGTSLHDLIVQQRLESAGERIFADLRIAQSESIKNNKNMFVSFNNSGANWCYGINEEANCDCTQANSCQINGVEKVVKGSTFKGITLQRARFAGGSNFTAFEPKRGFATASGVKNGTVWLKSSNDYQLAVVLNRLGRVRFCSPNLDKYSNQCPDAPAL